VKVRRGRSPWATRNSTTTVLPVEEQMASVLPILVILTCKRREELGEKEKD